MKYLPFFLIGLSITSYHLGEDWYLLNLFSHFQLQLVVLIFLSSILVFTRSINTALIGLVYSLLLFVTIWPVNFKYGDVDSANIYFQNAYIYNNQTELISGQVLKLEPQVVAIVELSSNLENSLHNQFQYQLVQGEGGERCGIFSDQKFKPVYYPDLIYPVCAGQFAEYQLLVIHPAPPLDSQWHNLQQIHFAEVMNIIDELDESDKKFVLVGDFNAAGFSPDFRRHFGKYFDTNYFTWQPLKPWSIPIDHALSNYDVSVTTGFKLGSDHTGLQITF